MQIVRSSIDRIQFVLVLVCVFAGFAISAADAAAQGTVTFQVTNLLDSGTGSLREAINDANSSNANTKIITFDVVDNGTITLLSDLPEITPDGVTINGNTAVNLAINGSSTTRIFDLGDGTDTTTVRDLELAGAPLQIGSGASLSFDVSGDQEFDNVIADAGRLIKEGDATLTLRGANTYSGGTLVRAGTLRGDTTSLQGAIAVDSGGLVAFDQGTSGTYTGAITGTGAVQKTGTGEVEFTGVNTYTGGTTISAGSLRGDTDSLQGNIAVDSGGEVVFEQATDATYAGNLTGTGGFTKLGAGTLTLSGTNTISGQSNLDAGALYGDFASIPRKLATLAGTSVTFDHDTNGTYAGGLSGAGDFNKLGTGTLTLSGTNTISGLASLDAGALQGGFASIPLNLSTAVGTEVIFNHANNGTYAGAISGMGDVTKSSSGVLSLSGINTFTGLTSITGGRLDVDGSLAAGVDVGANAVLGGVGSILGAVTVDGTVAPGKSIGELSVGSVTFAPGSVFAVEVEDLGMGGGNADRLVVTGNADLTGASVQVTPGAGNYLVPVEVTILTAGSTTGDFASFGPNFAFLDITHLTNNTSVLLTIERNTAGLGQYAQTPNQSTIATALEEALDAGTPTDDIFTVFQSLNVLTVDQVPNVLDSMTGETLTQFATTRLATAERFGRSLDARIRDHQWESNDAFITAGTGTAEASHLSANPLRPESNAIFGVAMLGVGPMGAPSVGSDAKEDSWIRTWIDGSGIYGDVDGNSNESGFDYTIWSGSIGLDVLLAEHWVLGLAGGYANTDLDFSSRPGDGEVDTYQGALYAGYVDPRFHVGVSGRYAYNEMDGKREIRFGDINRKARADLDGNDYGARFESGLNLFDVGGVVFQPTASLNYNHLTQDDVTESGAMSLNLALEDFDLDSLVTGVGMRVRGRWQIGPDLWMVPEFHGRWLHEFLDTDRFIEAQLVSAPAGASAFQIQGVELPRDSGSLGLAWSIITDSAWSVMGSYDVVLNEDLVQHMGRLTLNFEW